MTDSPTAGLASGSVARVRAGRARQRRAVRIMMVVLIPLAIWTVAGLIALWPKDVASHIDTEGITYGVVGVSYPTGRVTNVARISCEGVPGSTSGVNTQVCANLSVQVLGGEDTGKTVVVPVTHVIYASGISIGQRVSLVRIPPIDGQPAQYQFSDFSRGTPLLVLHPHLRCRSGSGGALARLRGATRARLRRTHPGHLLVPGADHRGESRPGRADRVVGDPLRGVVRRARPQRREHDRAGRLAWARSSSPLRWASSPPAGLI